MSNISHRSPFSPTLLATTDDGSNTSGGGYRPKPRPGEKKGG